MPDPRALANSRNLESYRAWNREGFKRTGFLPMIMTGMGLPLMLPLLAPIEHDPRKFLLVAGTAFAVYLAICLGWMVFAVLRLNAWKRAHPWSPPAPRSF